MGFFKYPYTDLNELNLDWVIAKIKYIEQAKNIIYDNSGTQLISNNVQDALTEIYTLISTQGVTSFNTRVGDVMPEAGDYTAAQVTYDNTNTGYIATDVQAAIDEADAKIEAVSQTVPVTYVETFNSRSGAVAPAAGDYNGTQVTYDNSQSGLTATDLQAAVDELAAAPGGVTSFNNRTGAVVPAASDYNAAQVDFDDTIAQTGSSNVQGALEYVATRGASAQYTTYDNTQSGLTATNVQDAIDEVAQDVLSSGVASFNGRTGAVNPQAGDYDLTDLGDVNISTPANDDVLKYDSVTQKWVNGAGGGGGASALSQLSDVDLTTPANGEVLTYDSVNSEWVNAVIPTPTVPSDLDDLSDVSITSPTAGQVLKFDGNDWINAAESGGGTDLSKTLAPVEIGDLASKAYRNGEIFIDKNGYLSITTAPVSMGSSLILNTNYIHQTLGELNGFGTLYTESPDGVKTWRVCLNNVFAFLQSLPVALRHKCQLYMNRHVYRSSYDYGATVDYTADIWSNTGVSSSRMQPATSTSTYQVKAEDGTMSNLSTAICDQIILVVINY